jgi:hypothetical protein
MSPVMDKLSFPSTPAMPEQAVQAVPTNAADILHLAELVPVVRGQFAVGPEFSDDAILASLRAITRWSDQRGRWRAAFNSNLGYALAIGGRDLNTALNTLLALLPRPLS